MVCVLLIAAYCCVEEHVLLSGIFLALACSIKIIPLFLTRSFSLLAAPRAKNGPTVHYRLCRFLSRRLVRCLGRFSTYFLKNVLGYSSYGGTWGITYWCVFLFKAFQMDLSPKSLDRLQSLLIALKALIVVLVIALAWLRRKQSGPELLRQSV